MRLPVLRWGQPYESLETADAVHFLTGEPVARISQANGGLVGRDMRKASAARAALREIPCAELINLVKKAADLYMNATLPMGDDSQSPAEFVRAQSATTGLPEHMCRANMEKNHFVLMRMDQILDALTRGLDLRILSDGHGEEGRGVVVSYQAQSPVLGVVLPSNSPGVHALWLPVIPLQLGLVLKPGPQEPWTPYRIASAFAEAGIPRETIAIYPGAGDVGAAVTSHCPRTLIFGSKQTVEQYRGNPRIQAHGPGFSKIVFGADAADEWEKHIDVMADSVFKNSGRSCINCSGIWTPRHGREIAQALAERLGPVEPAPPEAPDSPLAAFTDGNQARAIWGMIEPHLDKDGMIHATAGFGPRLVENGRCAYLRPTVVYCASPDTPMSHQEFLFPYVSVVDCPQETMVEAIGSTLVCSAITEDAAFRRALIDAVNIDRLNLGPIPTIQLNWLQPHEGNLIDFLFRARALQRADHLS